MNITHTSGDTFYKNMEFKLSDGSVVDITGYNIIFSIKKTPSSELLVQEEATINTGSDGIAEINVSGSDMQLDIGDYFYDIQLTDAGGQIITILKGIFTITYDIT